MTTRPPLGEQMTLADRDPARAARLTQGLKPWTQASPELLAQLVDLDDAAPVPNATAPAPTTPASAATPRRAGRSGYRKNSIFHMRGNFEWRVLDRNQRAKLWTIAQGMERLTKAKGHRNGCLGAVGLTILNCLLFRFLNSQSGRCDPSYDALQKMTGLCRQSIANGIDRLEASGLLTVTRRMMRCKERVVSAITGNAHDIVVTRQISNAYLLTNPAAVVIPERATQVAVSAFPPRRKMDGLTSALASLFEKIAGPSLSRRRQSKHPLATSYEIRNG
jgi:hypothetical protein